MKTQKICMLTGAVAAAVLSMGMAQAAETATTEDVKVTASRVERELMDVNMSVSVITAEDIARSEARTVGDLLQDIPGVEINNDGSQGMKRICIRGENAFRTLVMIDGQKIAEHKSMSGAPILIDPSQIERIEVIKGPASVLYGSDSIGGAVNIITKKGGDKPFGAEVSAGMDNSSNGKSIAASVYGNVDGWKYRLGLSHERGDELRTPVGDAKNSDFNSTSVNGFLSYDIDADKTIGLTVDHFDLDFMSGTMAPGYKDFFVDVPSWKRTKVGAFGEFRNLSDYLTRVRVDGYYQRSKKSMENYVSAEEMPMTIDNFSDNELDQYGFSLQTDWQLGENNYLITGYEFEYDDLDAKSDTTAIMPVYLPNKYYNTIGSYKGNQSVHAIFASMETQLPHDFTLSYGARYTYVKTDMGTSYGVKTYYSGKNAGKSQITSTPGSQHDDRVVFNAGITWSGIDDLVLRALWGQGFRAPLLQERYIPSSMGSMTGGQIYGNPDLKPETSDNFEVGARYQKGGLMVDTAAFLSLADDYITAVAYGPINSKYVNMAKAKTFGVELSTSFAIGDTGLEPYVNATWMRRQTKNAKGFETYDSATPAFSARYGVRWAGEHNGLALRTDVYARGQTARKYDDGDTSSDSDSYRLSGYTTLNMTAGVSFGPEKQYSLDAGFYNICNQEYRESQSIYEPARYFSLKLNARY